MKYHVIVFCEEDEENPILLECGESNGGFSVKENPILLWIADWFISTSKYISFG